MSDGTANLYFRDPSTFEVLGTVMVHDNLGPVVALNELEWVNGEVWANIWQWNFIARISPETGEVTGWIRCSGLTSPADSIPHDGVLNGIAYDAANDRVFITGKYWPKLYEVKIVPLATGKDR